MCICGAVTVTVPVFCFFVSEVTLLLFSVLSVESTVTAQVIYLTLDL